MKELITIIILLIIPFALNAQIWEVDFSEPNKKAHAIVGYVSGISINSITYAWLKDTRLKPWWSKLISFGSGAAGSALLGYTYEKWQKKRGGIYNPKDVKATFMGGAAGSFTLRLVLWGSITESKIPEGTIIYENKNDIPIDVWSLENEFINNN